MEFFFNILLKSSGILLLFFGVYSVFLRKETFFTVNRLFLLTGLIASVTLPFVTFTKTTYLTRTLPSPEPIRSEMFEAPAAISVPLQSDTFSLDFYAILLGLYLIGVCYGTTKFLLQILALKRLKNKSDQIVDENFVHIRTAGHIAPFSFFHFVFYCPQQFSKPELQTILTHEQVHVRGRHSIDVLLTELVLLLLWFNPVIWAYRKIVKQNLEFLADAKTCRLTKDRKHYQYLMLKQASGLPELAFINPFFSSFIKKRIVMLQQKPSKRSHYLKLLLILPLIGLFMASFNSAEVVSYVSLPEQAISAPVQAPPKFISPLAHSAIKKVSLTFGNAKDTADGKTKFHQGVDLVAASGTAVQASASGTVLKSTYTPGYGEQVVLQHQDGYTTKYAHLKNRAVAIGDQIKVGQPLGQVGSTGRASKPHLHFEIAKSGQNLDPAAWIPLPNTNTKSTPPKTLKTSSTPTTAAQRLELLISKNTTDKRLARMKKDLAKDHIDFSYKTTRNDAQEIIAISLKLSGTNGEGETFNGSYQFSAEGPIPPVRVQFDDKNNTVAFSNPANGNTGVSVTQEDNFTWEWSNGQDAQSNLVITESGETQEVQYKRNSLDKDSVSVASNLLVLHSSNDSNIQIHTSDTSNEGYKVTFKSKKKARTSTTQEKSAADIIYTDQNLLLLDPQEATPLLLLDGKEVTKKELQQLSSKNIKAVEVRKGTGAIAEYGDSAKNGVVEITTKAKN
ncbi:MAG: peptidoglycan DD-metalloendopeptidase family protein [Bacteroidota bacterium]